MAFLYWLESIRVPILDELMLLITRFGEETAFLAAAIITFWCVDKRRGYYVLFVGFLGTMLNQFLKLLCQVPRPWIVDPKFTVVAGAKEAANGFSFPSGHSTSAVGTFGALALVTKNRPVKGLWIAICLLVPFSRMYLGVHTPMDVLVGSLTALFLALALRPVAKGASERGMKDCIRLMLIMAAALTLFAHLYPFSIAADQLSNLESGVKNGYTMLGCIAGLMVVYPLEKKYVNFESKAIWWAQLLKVFLGLALVIGVKEGLRSPLEALFAGHMAARAVRYFLIVLVAGLVWPMTFRWFCKLGAKK